MRIDIGANSIRPELAPSRSTADVFEMKNRGEHVRGRVIDVNQNIVLIQSSSGREFTASTVVPMENFIGEEMSFAILIGSEGELILKPELDEKKQSLLHELKIEDMLYKLNKAVTPENKEIMKNMIQSGIAVNEDSFQEIKNLSLAMRLLQRMPEGQLDPQQQEVSIDALMKAEEGSEQAVSSSAKAVLAQEFSLKDIITLKGLRLEVNVQNLKALHQVNQALAGRESDVFGLKKLMEEHFGGKLQRAAEEQIGAEQGDSVFETSAAGIENSAEAAADETAESGGILQGDGKPVRSGQRTALESAFSSPEGERERIGGEEASKVSREMLKELLSQITKDSVRRLGEKRERGFLDRSSEEYLKLDVEKLSKDLKTVLSSMSKESELGRSIEREILPKTEIVREFLREFQLNILPFQVDRYENVAQYYVKKNRNKNKKDEGITVAFSLDTFHHGNVRAMLDYRSDKVISVEISLEDKRFEQPFRQALEELKERLAGLGYTNIALSTSVSEGKKKSITEDKIYPNYEAKSFETWV